MLNLVLLSMALGVSASTCQLISGNYYCDQTRLVQYTDVGFAGQYNRVTSFNTDGTCSSTPQSFSGALSPLDEELSVHFRGPIRLDHFQVYTKGGSSVSKRELHHRHAEPEPVVVTEYNYHTDYVYVTAGANTATVAESPKSEAPAAPASSSSSSAPGTYTTSEEHSSAAPAPETSSSSSSEGSTLNYNFNHHDQTSITGPSVITLSTSTSSSSTAAPIPTTTSSGSSWTQIANYDGAAATSNGLVFLNNLGGQKSGVFDFTFGNSLSYAAADGVSSAASSEVLEHTTVPSNKEFIVFADTKCSGNDCGYYRPGTVAYHGFGGPTKVFVFEFGMPSDGTTGFNADMPAVWFLNAQIPRTLQYGAQSCSCWASGCGELDLWEVLNSGNTRMVSTLHDKQNGGGGSANYFERPTSGSLKGAVVFDGTTISIVEIDSIPSSIDDSIIDSWLSKAGTSSKVNM